MDDNTRSPPAELAQAVAALWRLKPPGPEDLFSAPEFTRLHEICKNLYPDADSKGGLSCALRHALQNFGMPSGLAQSDAHLALSADVAAWRLDAAFRRTRSTRIHLCPLDCADDLPSLSFGPNSVRRFSEVELEALVDPQRLKRNDPTWNFDAKRFSAFYWLVVEEVVPLKSKPPERTWGPFTNPSWVGGAIEPHQERFTGVVEAALFALMLAPWEDWVVVYDHDWRGFWVPWIYTVDDDVFVRPGPPPSPERLSWELELLDEEIELGLERPFCIPLVDKATEAPKWLNDTTWSNLMRARQSPLFGSPIPHFLVRAFLTEGIDEFLAHITVIEAALGLSRDYDSRNRPRLSGGKNPGATVRVAARLSALLSEQAAGDDYRRLFDARSAFLHGRTMSPISGYERILVRRLARRAVVALVKAALSNPAPSSRDEYLDTLLTAGSAFI